jgi:NADPH:quinone reductase-like Zn-dependent oxidoreductase
VADFDNRHSIITRGSSRKTQQDVDEIERMAGVSLATEMQHAKGVEKPARAVRVTSEFGIDQLTFDELPISRPGPGQVLVEIRAVSLNYRDYMVVTGKYNPKLARPMVIGSDGAGEVVAVGDGVTHFKVGDRVAGSFFQNWINGPLTREHGRSALGGSIDGVLTSARLFPQHGLVDLPPHLSYEEGATLPCAGVTAWQALVPTAHIKAGDSVLLLGTGGVSIFGLQFAKLHGARAIITSSSDEKLARAKALGADEIINYKKTPDWDKAVLDATGGEGVDAVLETGGAGTLAKSLKSTRPQGQVAIIGVLTGVHEPLNILPILQGCIRVQGIYVGSAATLKEMSRAIAANRLKPVIDRVFSFEQTREALRYMERAQHFGKIAISVG